MFDEMIGRISVWVLMFWIFLYVIHYSCAPCVAFLTSFFVVACVCVDFCRMACLMQPNVFEGFS